MSSNKENLYKMFKEANWNVQDLSDGIRVVIQTPENEGKLFFSFADDGVLGSIHVSFSVDYYQQ